MPDEYSTIQSAIDASSDGDSVLVSPGTFVENINYNGKNIVIGSLYLTTQDTSYISSTIIDGNQSGSVVNFNSNESSSAQLIGLTIKNGNANKGGGIFCGNSCSPTLDYLYITNNEAIEFGGGIFLDVGSNAVIKYSIIANNQASGLNGNGGGIGGVGIYLNASIQNCTIVGNAAWESGSGIYINPGSPNPNTNVQIINTILRNEQLLCPYCPLGNSYEEISSHQGGDTEQNDPNFTVSYSNIRNGWSGEGIIDADPIFINPESNNYNLDISSPCIDTGGPESELDPDGTRADMGAFYFHQEQDIYGCTDPEATNYDSDANVDDGSCEYEPYFDTIWDEMNATIMAIYIVSAELDGISLSNGDEVGIFDGDACVGVAHLDSPIDEVCQVFVPADAPDTPELDGYTAGNPISFWYWDESSQTEYTDVNITFESGSSTYQDFATTFVELFYYHIYGCTDMEACNYNPDTNTDDGSCEYLDPYYCNCENEILDCMGVCGGSDVVDDCGECGGDGTSSGDMNCDGALNVLDIVLMANLVLEDGYATYADVNEDGFVNILDLVIMVNWLLYGEPSICDGLTEVELWGEVYDIETTTYISLVNNGLTGSIPSEIGCLTNLTVLNLSHNQLSGEIPPEIGQLTNLEYLDLSNNQLTGEIPSEIWEMTNLEYLDLSNNQLTGEIPSEIWEMTNLEELTLFSNQLSGEIPPEIGNLTNLFFLYLDDNQLSGEIPPEIGQLTNLWDLILSNNQLSGEIPPEIGQLTNLEWLYLQENQLTGLIPEEICNPGLISPSLNGNQLCPPYPDCGGGEITSEEQQDTSNCD